MPARDFDERSSSEQKRINNQPVLTPTDHLLRDYEARLEKIYNERTAGDHTFLGVLASYTMDLRKIDAE